MLHSIKRLFVDTMGNYLFFAPLVIALTPALRTMDGATGYLIAAVPIALIGARTYSLFLKYVWYPLWHEQF